MINRLFMIIFASIVIIFDQYSKLWAAENLILGVEKNILNDFLSFILIKNTGAAFNLFAEQTAILSVFSAVVAVVIVVYFIKKRVFMPWYLVLGWGLILGGTVGNLIDRVTLGYVIDFIKIGFINSPVFNIADVAINVGALIILINAIGSIAEEKKENESNSNG